MKYRVKLILHTLIIISLLAGFALAQSDILKPKEEVIKMSVSGEIFDFNTVQKAMEEEIYISAFDPKIPQAAAKLGANYKIDDKEKIIIITKDADEYRLNLEKMQLEVNKEVSDLALESIIYKEKLYLPMKVLFKLMGGQIVYDSEKGKYYCDPMIASVDLIKDGSRYTLKINATGPVNYNYFYLRSPQRYVLDVQNAILVLDKKEAGNEETGIIKFSQFNAKPNIVRFVIPLDKDIEVEAQPRTYLNQVVFTLSLPKVTTSIANFGKARIKEVGVKQYKDGFLVKIESDAPFQYQWHRLKPPDNRMFIDIPNGILTDKAKSFEIDGSEYLKLVKVAQFQKDPKPITRIVLNFKRPAVCNVYSEGANQLLVEVKEEDQKEEDMAYTGAGVTSFPAKGKIICIDPGHGGSDTGAINRSLGIYEKTLNLDISRRLRDILIREGWNVIMTRDEDEDVTSAEASAAQELGARAKIANDMKADIFISVHCNAMYDTSKNGTMNFWYKKIDHDLAVALQKAMVPRMGLADKGVIRARFYVLRLTKMPAALIECGFMSNYKEAKLLADPEFRQKIAEGIADGLRIYIAEQQQIP
ncbi:MAG: N-acetylmuramoyl-L-alanine amidase [Armatimonadota bacterium]